MFQSVLEELANWQSAKYFYLSMFFIESGLSAEALVNIYKYKNGVFDLSTKFLQFLYNPLQEQHVSQSLYVYHSPLSHFYVNTIPTLKKD